MHLGEICPDIQATSDMRIDPRHLLPSYSGCIWHNPESAQPTVRLFMRSISAVWMMSANASICYAAHNRAGADKTIGNFESDMPSWGEEMLKKNEF
jgi:hypothetical protein